MSTESTEPPPPSTLDTLRQARQETESTEPPPPSTLDTHVARQAKKLLGKQLKRKRIEDAGGIRPRAPRTTKVLKTEPDTTTLQRRKTTISNKTQKHPAHTHRFGDVMATAPCFHQPRTHTLSIAIPGSIIANAQTRELRTQLVGKIARAATLYHVDEIIVYDDHLSKVMKDRDTVHGINYGVQHRYTRNATTETTENDQPTTKQDSADPHTFLTRLLQYCECPQYLRKHFFPMHADLQHTGLLPPLDAPHHVRVGERTPYREGVVLDSLTENGKGSLVNCGIAKQPVRIDKILTTGIRCTVRISARAYGQARGCYGTVVSPRTPVLENGTYWGYTTRRVSSLTKIFEDCPYGKYDWTIGTSERASDTLEEGSLDVPEFEHGLVVFGGVAGIEECVDNDESVKISGEKSCMLFDKWVNICPFQGSRTIRTEEAVLITLARLSPFMERKVGGKGIRKTKTLSVSELDKGTFHPNPKGTALGILGKAVFSDVEVSEEDSVSK